MNKTLLLTVSAILASILSFAQVSVKSTDGYTVTVSVNPTIIDVNGNNNCKWGYSYKIVYNYTVTFSGTNIPKKLYTLNGTFVSSQEGSIFFELPEKEGFGTDKSSNDYRDFTDCATVTPASAGFNMINITIEGPGISARTISLPTQVVLPVKMTSFHADLLGKTVKVKWATASELNNEFFTVERSADGIEWTAVQKVKGAGTTNDAKNYEVTDLSPLSGISYYRIRQTDIDGKSTISEVRTVKYEATTKTISLFPIPNAGNTVNISGINDFSKNDFALLNTSGHVIYNTTLSGPSVQLPSIAKGVYFIRINNKATGEVTNLRYVKL